MYNNFYNKYNDDIEQIKDKLGMPIDQGIRHALRAIWMWGVPTDGSCEGHGVWPDTRIGPAGHPWIDVCTPDDFENPDEWRRANTRERKKIGYLLKEFRYQQSLARHQKAFLTRCEPSLEEQRKWPYFFIERIGIFGAFRINASSLVHMNEFADFLINKYLLEFQNHVNKTTNKLYDERDLLFKARRLNQFKSGDVKRLADICAEITGLEVVGREILSIPVKEKFSIWKMFREMFI